MPHRDQYRVWALAALVLALLLMLCTAATGWSAAAPLPELDGEELNAADADAELLERRVDRDLPTPGGSVLVLPPEAPCAEYARSDWPAPTGPRYGHHRPLASAPRAPPAPAF